jgi:uncharacterized protein YxjI
MRLTPSMPYSATKFSSPIIMSCIALRSLKSFNEKCLNLRDKFNINNQNKNYIFANSKIVISYLL